MKKPDRKGRGGMTRRDALLVLGAAMLPLPASAQFIQKGPACLLTPEQTEGPYFSDQRLRRSDIRTDPADGSVKPGVPLNVNLRVLAVQDNDCSPLAGAVVDLWHCDAAGVYSDAVDPSFDTRGKRFLRGYQVTDEDGTVRFLTIYPGWYPGRTVHMHFKVRAKASPQHMIEATSQLYFPDRLTDAIHERAPYASEGRRRTRNEDDFLFRRGGRLLMLDVTKQGQGYAASFDVGVEI